MAFNVEVDNALVLTTNPISLFILSIYFNINIEINPAVFSVSVVVSFTITVLWHKNYIHKYIHKNDIVCIFFNY